MKIQLTEKFWEKVNDHQEKSKRALVKSDFMTYDQLCYVIAGTDIDKASYLVFRSTTKYDPHDFPLEKKTFIGDDLYFDTESFEVIDESQYFAEIEKEIPPKAPDQFLGESSDSKCHCNCHCNEEKDICKELVLSLAAEIENCYLGEIDEKCTYLEPAIKSTLNKILQYKKDEDYKKMDVFEKIRIIMKQYEKASKKFKTSAEADLFKEHTFRRVLEELADFGLFKTVEVEAIQPVPVNEPNFPSFNERVIGTIVEKLKYQDHSEEQ